MKRLGPPAVFLLLSFVFATFTAPRVCAQGGAVDFVARATPASGIEEPIRGFPFFLLSRSFTDIFQETDKHYPKPDMDAFIDKLEVSKELKAWMKKNKTVSLQGEDFIHLVKVDDVMNIQEFYNAYMSRNAGDESYNFPKPKYKLQDKTKNPAKYEKLKLEYDAAVRKYITDYPQSIDGIDLNLVDKDPTKKWADVEAKRRPEIRQEALGLAQSKYLVARTETDLEGHGSLRDIPPGRYWLTNLELAANVGDARLRWDLPVTVPAGGVTSVSLSNGNAIQPAGTATRTP
jgi:hypothetical protein